MEPSAESYFIKDDDAGEQPDDLIIRSIYVEEIGLIHSLGIPLNKPVALSDVTDISSIAKNMCYEQYSANKYRTQVVDLYFKTLLYKIGEKILLKTDNSKVSESVYFEKLLWIRESIYRWPSRDYSIDEMANDLSLSRSRFQHLYSETFGTSVKADLIKSRMDKACELLLNSSLSVKEIGCVIGYGNTSYFIRLFGNTFGITPMQYRGKEKNV